MAAAGRRRPGGGTPLAAPLSALAVATAVLPFFAFRFTTAWVNALGILSGIAVAGMASDLLAGVRERRRVLALVVGANVLVAVYGYLQYAGADPFRWAYSYGGMRPFSTLGNPNFLGGHFATLLPWAVVLFMFEGNPAKRIAWFLLAAAWGMLILVSQTRGSWIASGVSLLFLLWLIRRREPAIFQSQLKWISLAGAAALVAGLVLASGNREIVERVQSVNKPLFGQMAKRITAWRAAAFMLRENPVTGIGGNCFKHGYGKYMAKAIPPSEYAQFTHTYAEEYTHSDPIQMLAEKGVVGFGIFAWMVVTAVVLLMRRAGPLPLAALAGGVGFFVHGMFNFPLYIAPTAFLFWLGIGLSAPAGPASRAPEAAPAKRWPAGVAAAAALVVGVLAALIFGASHCNRKGNDYVRFQRWAEAQWYFERGEKLDWDDRREAFFVASMMFQRGDPPGSIPVFEVEMRRNPYYMDAFANLGSALGASGNVAEAELRLRRAIELNPAYAEAYSNLGVSLLHQRKFADSIAAFNRALELEPTQDLAKRGIEEAQKGLRKGGRR